MKRSLRVPRFYNTDICQFQASEGRWITLIGERRGFGFYLAISRATDSAAAGVRKCNVPLAWPDAESSGGQGRAVIPAIAPAPNRDQPSSGNSASVSTRVPATMPVAATVSQ